MNKTVHSFSFKNLFNFPCVSAVELLSRNYVIPSFHDDTSLFSPESLTS